MAEMKNAHPGLEIDLVESSGGVFEVTVGDNLVYSKKASGRFPEKGEVLGLIAK